MLLVDVILSAFSCTHNFTHREMKCQARLSRFIAPPSYKSLIEKSLESV